MIEDLLAKEEGKTLEFKENTKSLPKIIQTIVAFANTAGGCLVIGIKDKTNQSLGLVVQYHAKDHPSGESYFRAPLRAQA
jgi:ATP-dependent DNA helicase RecG